MTLTIPSESSFKTHVNTSTMENKRNVVVVSDHKHHIDRSTLPCTIPSVQLWKKICLILSIIDKHPN